jgi:hypothetical protein
MLLVCESPLLGNLFLDVGEIDFHVTSIGCPPMVVGGKSDSGNLRPMKSIVWRLTAVHDCPARHHRSAWSQLQFAGYCTRCVFLFCRPGVRSHTCKTSAASALTFFTLSAPRGTVLCRSSCARNPQPLFPMDKFRSSDARRSVRRNAACLLRPQVFRMPTLESCGCR